MAHIIGNTRVSALSGLASGDLFALPLCGAALAVCLGQDRAAGITRYGVLRGDAGAGRLCQGAASALCISFGQDWTLDLSLSVETLIERAPGAGDDALLILDDQGPCLIFGLDGPDALGLRVGDGTIIRQMPQLSAVVSNFAIWRGASDRHGEPEKPLLTWVQGVDGPSSGPASRGR